MKPFSLVRRIKPPHVQIPLRVVLIVPFVLQTIGAVGLIGYVSYRSGQQTVENLVHQLATEVGSRVDQQLHTYLITPTAINRLNARAVQINQVDLQNLPALEARLLNQLIQFDSLATLMFISPDGTFRTANRAGLPNAGMMDISVADFSKADEIISYAVNEKGQKGPVIGTIRGLDIRRDRPWYQLAVETGRPGWSPVFQLAKTDILTLNAYHPVYDLQTQALLGVFSINVSLNQISQFLSTLDNLHGGEVYIVEPSGLLIASSADATPFAFAAPGGSGSQTFTRLRPDQSQSALIRATSQQLQPGGGPMAYGVEPSHKTLRLNGDRYAVQIAPFQQEQGLNWQVITVVPQSAFMGSIEANRRHTLWLTGGTLGLAIALGWLTSRWITHPIRRIRQVSQALAQGDWELHQAITAGADYNTEFRVRLPDGSIRWVSSKGRVFYDKTGRPTRMAGADVDIIQRKLAQESLAKRERYLVALAQTQRLLLAARAEAPGYRTILQILGLASEASRVYLCWNYQDDSGQQWARWETEWCAEGVEAQIHRSHGQQFPIETRLPRWVARLSALQTIEGLVESFPASERTWLEAQGIQAILIMPLIVHDAVIGFIGFDNCQEARPWDLVEVSLLGAAISAISFYLERAQAETAFQESEATNRALIQSIPDLLIRMDRDGNYLNVLNPGEFSLLNPEQVKVGSNIHEIFPPAAVQERMQWVDLALQTGEPQSYEYQLTINGRVQYEEARIVPSGDGSVLVIVRDVSDRKLAEDQLRKTEQWLHQFSRQAPGMIYTIVREPDGSAWFEYISSAVEAIQGVTAEAVMADAHVLLDSIYPEDLDGYRAAVDQSAQTLQPFTHEWRTITTTGVVKWLQGRSQPERRSNGAIAWYGVVLDITEQKQTEQALNQAVQEIATHFEQSPLAIIQWDQDFRVLRWSQQAEQIFGWTAAEVIGRSWKDWPFVYAADRDRLEAKITPLVQGHLSNYAIENRNYTKDGQVITCEWYSSAVFDQAGNLMSVLSFAQNISDRKQTEEALRLSEQLFRGAFASSAFGISIRNAAGTYLQVNQAFCQMLGYTESELLSLTYSDITHPEDGSLAPDSTLLQLMAGKIPYYHLEKRYVHKHGQIVWGLVSISLVRDLQQQPLYFVAIIQDITDRKQAEQALRESEERFRSAFHSAPIGMALIGLGDRWLRVNSMLCRMLDYTEAELLAMKASSLVHPEDTEKLSQCIEQSLANQYRSAQAELRYLCKEGRVAWGLLSLSLVNDDQGTPLYCVAQIQDITERHAIDRMKKEFISIVSHELRTPLTAMQGALGLLIAGVYDHKPDKAKRMIQIAHNNSDRLVRLVNDILDLERLESDRVELAREVCEVENLMRQAVDGVQAIADAAMVQINLDAISAQVWAAPDAILQTLTNLLSNAIKFSPPQTQVQLSASRQLESVLFEVTDQGKGIPAEKLEVIFEKFQQVDVSDSRRKGGTGLGLAICRSIVQQHDGEIWAESTVGHGSTFFFTLPIPPS